MKHRTRPAVQSTERARRAEVVRLIITTREKFPHSPRLNAALRRVLWRYVSLHRKRRH